MPEKPTDGKTQKTQPRPRKPPKVMPKPFDIPVPAKSQIMRDFEKIATTKSVVNVEVRESRTKVRCVGRRQYWWTGRDLNP